MNINEYEKWANLRSLPIQSKVELVNGEIATIIKVNRVKFVGMIDGKPYNIPIGNFVKVVEVASQEDKKEYLKLKKGDMFCILYRDDAVLYTFDSIEKGKIIGINPITNIRTKIAPELFAKKIC